MTRFTTELDAKFLQNVESSTGHSMEYWLHRIESMQGILKDTIIVELKSRHRLKHIEAALLASIYLNGGKTVYSTGDDKTSQTQTEYEKD